MCLLTWLLLTLNGRKLGFSKVTFLDITPIKSFSALRDGELAEDCLLLHLRIPHGLQDKTTSAYPPAFAEPYSAATDRSARHPCLA